MMGTLTLRRILNVVYGYMTDGASDAELDEFDKTLARDPNLGPRPAKSKGVDQLMAMMGAHGLGPKGGTKKKPATAGGAP